LHSELTCVAFLSGEATCRLRRSACDSRRCGIPGEELRVQDYAGCSLRCVRGMRAERGCRRLWGRAVHALKGKAVAGEAYRVFWRTNLRASGGAFSWSVMGSFSLYRVPPASPTCAGQEARMKRKSQENTSRNQAGGEALTRRRQRWP